MTFGNSSCRRFSRLVHERSDRVLTEREIAFMDRHRCRCSECAQDEESSFMALNMLRSISMDLDVDRRFDDRVLRMAKVQQVRESIRYWSPAMMGAAVACLTIMAALHLASRPAEVRKAQLPAGEARQTSKPLFSFEINQPIRIDR